MADLSILEPYASRLQVVLDQSLLLFAPTWFERYFPIDTPQVGLTFKTIIGRNRIEAAATVASRDGETPLRSRPGLEKMDNEIPVLKEMFRMSETDWRNYEIMRAMAVSDEAKKAALLKILLDDMTRAGDSVMKRMDIFCLQGVSTGQISLNLNINPDGIVWQDPIDLMMPDANFKSSTVSWDNPTTAQPFDDIQAVVESAKAAGKSFSKMLISSNIWMKLIKIDSVKSIIGNWLGLRQASQMPTLANINAYMTDQLWPVFEIVDEQIGIEKDGKITPIKPFDQNNVSFIPAGQLGVIKNALAIEQMRPVENVSYATYKNALLSKWSQNEPFAEYTKVEWNAFPAFEAIDNIYILAAIHA